MAKKVNKKFVIMLGASLVVVASAGAGVMLYKKYRHQDPNALRVQAEKFEKDGKWVEAAEFYGQAAEASSRAKAIGTDLLYMKYSDAALEVSKRAKNPADGVRAYQISQSALQRALTENPNNRQVNERVLDNLYEWAQLDQSPAGWTKLDEMVGRYLQNEKTPTPKHVLYRAEARLRWVQSVNAKDVPESRFKAIDDDLKLAMKLDPESATAAALTGEFNLLKAARATGRGAMDDAKKLIADAQKELKAFLAKHPDEPSVAIALATSYVNQANEVHGNQQIPPEKRSKEAQPFLTSAMTVTKAAYAAHPGHVKLGETLAWMYMIGNPPEMAPQPELAKGIYLDLVKNNPEDPERYARLARFYEQTAKPLDAIAAYKECLAHTSTGGGIQAFKNDDLQRRSYAGIASLSLDQVEPGKEETPQAKALIEEASANIEKLRGAHGHRGQVDLLDGRVQFLNRRYPEAAVLLRSAESNLKNETYFADQYRQSLALLAMVNLFQSPPQLGGALQYIDQALALQPGNYLMILQRAQILNRLARYSDAQTAMENLLKYEHSLPPQAVSQAKTLLANAKAGLGDRASASEIYSQLDSARSLVQLAWSNLAGDDVEGAAEAAKRALDKEPDNLDALRVAAICYARLDRKDQALKYAERGLAKSPKNPNFEMIKSTLTQGMPNSPEAQEKILAAISDPYIRNLQLANLHHQTGDVRKEIESLKEAETSIDDVTSMDGRQKQSELIDRIFSAYASNAVATQDAALRAELWKGAESYVQKAEQKNVDGVNGKLYRGRLDIMRSNGAAGLKTLEDAVQQRQDFAYGHGVLGQAYVLQGRYDAALDEFRAAVRLAPNNLNYIIRAVELLVRKADPRSMQEAKELLDQATAVAPRDQRLAQYNDWFGDREKAIKAREEIAKAQPNNIENLRRLAMLYVQNKDKDPRALEKATALVRPLYVKNPLDLDVVEQLSRIYAEQNLADEGVRLFEGVTSNSDANIRYQGLILLGEFCKRVGRNDQAAASFREAIKLKPEGNDDADRHLADMYFDLDDMANAETAYQAIVANAKPGTGRNLAVRRLIETQIRQKKFTNAEELLNKEVLKDHPKDPQGLVLQAYAYIQQGKQKEAIADLDRVLADNRDYADALYYRALAQFSIHGNLEQAISDLLTLVNKDPKAINARILLAQVYRYSQRFAEASNEYSEILKLHPEQFTVRRDYAQFLMELAGVQQRLPERSSDNFSMAIRRLRPVEVLQELLRDSSAKYPQQGIWVLMTAELSSLTGNTREAQGTYERLYRNFPDDPVAVNSYLKSLLQTRNYEEAVTVASKAIARRPEILDYYTQRATALVALNRMQEAGADIDRGLGLACEASKQSKQFDTYLAVVNQAAEGVTPDLLAARLQVRIGADPDETISTIALIHMLVAANRAPDALSVVTSARVPADNKDLQYLFNKEAGMVYYQLKKYPESAKAFETALDLMPGDIEVLNNYAFLLADGLNRPKEALTYIDRAQKAIEASANPTLLMANTANVADTYGWVKFLAGDSKGAIEQLGRAIQSQPMPVTFYHLALVYKKQADGTRDPSDKEANLKLARDAVSDGLRIAAGTKDATTGDLEKLQKELAPKPVR